MTFDVPDLLDAARAATSLECFGDPTFREGLEVLANALEREGGLSPTGRAAYRAQVVGYLCERLRIEDWYERHPEIEAQAIERPVFVTGLPRTGTTVLSNLLAVDPGARSLRFWESQRPTPPPERATYDSDPRIAEGDAALTAMKAAAPDLARMHDDTGASPTENQDLLGQHFRTQHFEGQAAIPSYLSWWLACDMVPAYRHHRRVLKLLQWRCPGVWWNLKSPPDLCCLDAFVAVYPDARIIWTHRDPAKVLPSVCRLIATVRSLFNENVDPVALGRQELALWAEATRRGLAFRARVGQQRIVDVHMDDLVARPIETMRELYPRLGLELTADTERRMRSWLDANPQHKHGALHYRLEDFGLTSDQVRAAFGDYRAYVAGQSGR